MAPDIFFPQLNVALVVRKHCPNGGRFVTSWGDQTVYLIETSTPPRGSQIADRLLGGWNYPSGETVHLVYARRFTALTLFCKKEHGDKLVKTRLLPNGLFVNLVRTQTKISMSMGVTPVLAEAELAEDE